MWLAYNARRGRLIAPNKHEMKRLTQSRADPIPSRPNPEQAQSRAGYPQGVPLPYHAVAIASLGLLWCKADQKIQCVLTRCAAFLKYQVLCATCDAPGYSAPYRSESASSPTMYERPNHNIQRLPPVLRWLCPWPRTRHHYLSQGHLYAEPGRDQCRWPGAGHVPH